METLSPKLEHELRWLFKSYAAGSQGNLYYPNTSEDTPTKKSYIRVKRLAKLGYAKSDGFCIGHPVYSITELGIQYALAKKLPKREPFVKPLRRRYRES